VKKHGGLTQVELAGATGLSPASVSNIVKELASNGILHTAPSTRSGRRAQYVTLARTLGLVAAVDFSERHMRIALADGAQKILSEKHMPLAKDHRADNELDRTMMMLADMLDSVEAGMDEVLTLCVGLPAPVLRKTGVIARRGILRGWDGIPVAEVLQRRFRRSVLVENSSNLAALAESRYGSARGIRNSIFINVDDGIGAGLILNGELFRGRNGTAGEVGHTTILENGPLCRCGNRGCLEAIAGGAAVLENLRDHLGSLKLNEVVVHAMAGDAACLRAVADAGRHIGIAAANLCNVVDPERIVVGGQLARAGELLLGPLRQSVERSVIVDQGFMPEIVQGQLGNRAAIMGAVAYAVDGVHIATG
jgi:predicted NBD/HSP70 family sugar kinase